ncbi:hypothetical protein R3W88_030192 [Solanum pinnatisectum]|uniref:F-box domain-containing protein n=1 Tax=Solanum pinnatisectum TaxID=50273 RepID=A0AAV9K7M4_9SOLN|nr:hypothetical protein R3W88_030192 [Solanum pinnatisectum]
MKRCKLFVCEEIIINILNRLPLKSVAKFKCISKNWRKYIAEIYRRRFQWPEPYLLGFFCLEKRCQSCFFYSSKESPLVFIGERVYIVASSNDSVSFTIVRYVISEHYQSSITIESFSSEINVWTDYKLIVDVPHALYPSLDETSLSSAGVVDGVFFWLNYTLITIYDSVNKCFWAMELPENLFFYYPRSC